MCFIFNQAGESDHSVISFVLHLEYLIRADMWVEVLNAPGNPGTTRELRGGKKKLVLIISYRFDVLTMSYLH